MFIKGTSGATGHPKLHTYHEGLILPVLKADELLFSSRHKGLLRQFRDLAGLSDDAFEKLYGRLINQFLEFVQILPEKQNGVLGSMINYAFARTSVVFQKYCQLKKTASPLLKFAVFSAILLKGVGKMISQQRIVMVDENGEYFNDWNPLSGSMVGLTEYYKIYPISARYLRIESEVTPLLARQLLSKETFLWISNDFLIFSDWLTMLLSEEGENEREITWVLRLFNREDFISVLNTLDGAPIEGKISAATEYGEQFLQWLKEQIEAQKLLMNTDDAKMHIVEQGVFIEEKLFKEFADLKNLSVNWQVVYKQFANIMGIAEKSGQDFLHVQFISPNEGAAKIAAFSGALSNRPHMVRDGLLIGDPGLILMSAQTPATTHLLKAIQPKIPEHHKQPPTANHIQMKLQQGYTQNK